ncbi:hypothetical protein EYF80_032869 [Liparis tanakae]|uniref:Uncharacterized protein n=1 Tax=Liparis tanakae TaxID=230148 RepID=A0A4Z2GTX8_9TELE|nr:hypothetical protein EYF80_032869 [Liparis tanakae]
MRGTLRAAATPTTRDKRSTSRSTRAFLQSLISVDYSISTPKIPIITWCRDPDPNIPIAWTSFCGDTEARRRPDTKTEGVNPPPGQWIELPQTRVPVVD